MKPPFTRRFRRTLFFCGWVLSMVTTFGYAQENAYLRVTGPCDFRFPEDHGAHPGYRVEWWYYTGNLKGRSSERYGFQLTFFRVQTTPPGSEKNWPHHPSAWRTKDLYLAHAALSDLKRGRFLKEERMSRSALGLAGSEKRQTGIRIFLGTWSAQLNEGNHHLMVKTDDFSMDLDLKPLKPPIAHGERGYSLKGSSPDQASCYYSLTRLEASGTLGLEGKLFYLNGTAWMDHEFSTAPLDPELKGWDWFSVQLTDNTELMIYVLRDRQGGWSTASSGTFVDDSGIPYHLKLKDFQVDVLDHWKSPHSGGRYPSRWRLTVHPLRMDLLIVPNLADQEMITEETTHVAYWEGSVFATGRVGRKSLEGIGYVEMTGYAKTFDLLK